MLEQGLIEEVRGLFERGDLNSDLPSMRCVGYRQVWSYLAGELDKQMTWLRTQMDAHWFDSLKPNMTQSVLKFLAKIHKLF